MRFVLLGALGTQRDCNADVASVQSGVGFLHDVCSCSKGHGLHLKLGFVEMHWAVGEKRLGLFVRCCSLQIW